MVDFAAIIGPDFRPAVSRTVAALVLVLSGISSAMAQPTEDGANLEGSSLPYVMSFSTSGGGLKLTAHRDGHLITVEGRRDDGSRYTITRRGGYDLAYVYPSGRTEIAYAGVSTDTPIAVAQPARYETTVTVFRGGKASSARYKSTLTYIGDETVAVSPCAFRTLHYVQAEQNLDGPPSLLKVERWFSPDLNMTLRLIESRQEHGGPAKRFFEAHATAISE